MAHPTKNTAITALLTSSSIREAAKKSGIPERTLTRWMSQAEFVQALREAESLALRDAVRSLAGDMQANFELMQIVRDDIYLPAHVRLKAAVAIDGAHRAWREIQDIDERLTRLEAQYASKA